MTDGLALPLVAHFLPASVPFSCSQAHFLPASGRERSHYGPGLWTTSLRCGGFGPTLPKKGTMAEMEEDERRNLNLINGRMKQT